MAVHNLGGVQIRLQCGKAGKREVHSQVPYEDQYTPLRTIIDLP